MSRKAFAERHWIIDRRAPDPGLLMVAAAATALIATNFVPGLHFERLWSSQAAIGWGKEHVRVDLSLIVVKGLMTLFFLYVGLEIRREIAFGTLRSRRAAITPVICAASGMIAPMLVYRAFAGQGAATAGWAIPSATDVALAVGMIGLVAPGLSPGARAFLLTLAVADDVGGVAIIGLFYTHHVEPLPVATAIFLAIAAATTIRTGTLRPVAGLALLLPAWILMSGAHIEPAIVGAAFGLLMPIGAAPRGRPVWHELKRFHRRLELVVTATILPLFAAICASVPLDKGTASLGVATGVALGLCVGKPLGIFGALQVLDKTGVGRRPTGSSTLELLGVSILGGIGFTVSLYIARVSFTDGPLQQSATLGVLAGSVLAVTFGAFYFRVARARRNPTQPTRA